MYVAAVTNGNGNERLVVGPRQQSSIKRDDGRLSYIQYRAQ